MNLKAKLVFIPVIIIILSLASATVFSLKNFENISKKTLLENQKLLVESMVFTADEFLNKYKDVITMTRESDVVKDTSQYKNIKVETRGLSDSEAIELRQLFKDTREVYPQFAYLETFTPDKAINVVLEPYKSQLGISEEAYTKGFAFRDWYIGAMEAKNTYISDAYVSASIMEPVTAISTPIFGENNNITGIFIGAVRLVDLSTMIKKLGYGETGITYIVDKNGALVAHPDDNYFKEKTLFSMKETEIVASALENHGDMENSTIMYDSISGEDVFVYYKQMEATNWYIISQQAVSEAMGPVRALTLGITGITLVIIIITAIFLYVNARNILVPLIKLTSISKKISNNNLALDQNEASSLRTVSVRKDEIGLLYYSFKQMYDNLTNIIKGLYSVTREVSSSSDLISQRIKGVNESFIEIDTTVSEIAKAASQQAIQTQDGAEKTSQLAEKQELNKYKMRELNSTFSIIKDSTELAQINLDKLKEKNTSNNSVTYNLYENVKQTDESSRKISSISNVIASIADQTNLLALNAAIEAARAGEAGKGFAVVADEIRKLAEESTKSTKQIDELLKELQRNSTISVDSINNLLKATEIQLEFLNQSEEQNKKVLTALNEEESVINDLNTVSTQINSINDEMIEIISDLSAVAEENAAGCEEASATTTQQTVGISQIIQETENLKEVLEKLFHQVEKFSIE